MPQNCSWVSFFFFTAKAENLKFSRYFSILSTCDPFTHFSWIGIYNLAPDLGGQRDSLGTTFQENRTKIRRFLSCTIHNPSNIEIQIIRKGLWTFPPRVPVRDTVKFLVELCGSTPVPGVLPIMPKIPEISVGIQMVKFVSVSSDRNIRDHLWRWSTYFGRQYSDRNSSFHFWQTGS